MAFFSDDRGLALSRETKSDFPSIPAEFLNALLTFLLLLLNHVAKDLNVSCQNRQRHIPFETIQAMVRAPIQTVVLQRIDGRFYR